MNSIIIIEDHPIMREGLAAWFTKTGRWNVRGTAATLAEAKALFAAGLQAECPYADIVLLDIELPDGWGLDLIPYLQQPQPVIAVYSSFNDYAHASAALGMGVKAYVCKRRNEQELEAALLQALNGKTWIDDTAQTRLENTSSLIELLTKREVEILGLVKSGLSNKQIAARLGIAVYTVANILSHVYGKTGIHSRLELLKL